jgi:UDP-glucose 4-epimerase
MTNGPVIVTGAGGYVGQAIAAGLQADGIDVLGMVRSPPTEAMGRCYVLDLELDSLATAIESLAPRAIVHCAASVPLPRRRADDEAGAASTRAMDANVADACALLGCRLIYLSSCIVYDPLDPATKDERSPVRASTPYAAAKLDGEGRVAALDGSVVLRIPSPVGGLTERRAVVDLFVERAVRGEDLEVWGTGSREQDFIHVDDISAFISRALADGVAGTFNVASGVPVTMRELAEQVVAHVGSGTVVTADRADPQEGHTARFDITAARGLGWAPLTDLGAVIRDRVELAR